MLTIPLNLIIFILTFQKLISSGKMKATIFFLQVFLFLLFTNFALSTRKLVSFTDDDDESAQQRDVVSDFNCSTVPPALWCASDKVQQQCGFTQKCSEYGQAVRNQPVHITLLYEGLCKYCIFGTSD
jgi:hypothetical protein